MKLFEYEKEQARRISFWLVLGNFGLTLLLLALIGVKGWTLFWPVCFIPAGAEYIFFLVRGWISGWYVPAWRIGFLLAHAALPVIGWFLLDRGRYVGKTLIWFSWKLGLGLAIFALLVLFLSGFFWVPSAAFAFPAFALDFLYIYLLRKTVKTWKPA